MRLCEKYVSLRPSHNPKCSQDLYLRPLKRYTEHVWYSCQPLVGLNTLQSVTSKLAESVKIKEKQTNHSLRATVPTHMYQFGMDDKLVQDVTGHRSNAVLEYKHTNNDQKKNVSEVLYGNS